MEENINEGQPREHDISKIIIKYWKDYNLTKLDMAPKLDLMEPSTYLMEGPWKIDGWNLKKVNGTMRIVGGTMIIIYGTMSIIGAHGSTNNAHLQ